LGVEAERARFSDGLFSVFISPESTSSLRMKAHPSTRAASAGGWAVRGALSAVRCTEPPIEDLSAASPHRAGSAKLFLLWENPFNFKREIRYFYDSKTIHAEAAKEKARSAKKNKRPRKESTTGRQTIIDRCHST